MVSLNAGFSKVCLVTDRHYEVVKIKSKLFAFETKYHGTKVQYVYLLGMIWALFLTLFGNLQSIFQKIFLLLDISAFWWNHNSDSFCLFQYVHTISLNWNKQLRCQEIVAFHVHSTDPRDLVALLHYHYVVKQESIAASNAFLVESHPFWNTVLWCLEYFIKDIYDMCVIICVCHICDIYNIHYMCIICLCFIYVNVKYSRRNNSA